LLVIYFLVMLGFSFFYIGFPVHAVRELGWSVTDAGLFFAFLSLLMVVVQGPILAKASKIFSGTTLTICGTLMLTIGFSGLFYGSNLTNYAAAAFIALGNGLMWPSVMAMLSRVAGNQHQGAVQGAASSVGAVASIVGFVTAGLIYNLLGAWVFVLAAALILPVIFITPHFPK
jgi:MFS family permease